MSQRQINRRLNHLEAKAQAARQPRTLTSDERIAGLQALEARVSSGQASPVEFSRLIRIRALLARIRRRVENERSQKEV